MSRLIYPRPHPDFPDPGLDALIDEIEAYERQNAMTQNTKTVYAVEVAADPANRDALAALVAAQTGEEFVGFYCPDEEFDDNLFVVDSQNAKLASILAKVAGIEVLSERQPKQLILYRGRWIDQSDLWELEEMDMGE